MNEQKRREEVGPGGQEVSGVKRKRLEYAVSARRQALEYYGPALPCLSTIMVDAQKYVVANREMSTQGSMAYTDRNMAMSDI